MVVLIMVIMVATLIKTEVKVYLRFMVFLHLYLFPIKSPLLLDIVFVGRLRRCDITDKTTVS